MTGRKKKTETGRRGRRKGPLTAKLGRMIEEAIVDADGESEQTVGFSSMLEDNLKVPFQTEILASWSPWSGST